MGYQFHTERKFYSEPDVRLTLYLWNNLHPRHEEISWLPVLASIGYLKFDLQYTLINGANTIYTYCRLRHSSQFQ